MALIMRSARPYRHRTRALVRAAAFLAMCAATFWGLLGHAELVEALVPTDAMLRFSEFIADASSSALILLLVGVIAASVLIWLAMCSVFCAFLSAVDLVHRSASRRRRELRRSRLNPRPVPRELPGRRTRTAHWREAAL